jgi:hypothetical protein
VVSAQQLVDVADVAEMPSVLVELPLTSIRLKTLLMAEMPLAELAEMAEALPPAVEIGDLIGASRPGVLILNHSFLGNRNLNGS